MIKKYKNRTLQTNPRHRDEEPQNDDKHKEDTVEQPAHSFPSRWLQN